MSSPQPAKVVAGLYNELVKLQPSDRAAIGRIVWQLRKLRRAMPSDVATAVALAQSLALSGEPAEAGALAEELWGLWRLMDAELVYAYANLLTGLGKFSRTVELARTLPKIIIDQPDKDWRFLAAHSAFAAGDIESIGHFGAGSMALSTANPSTNQLLRELNNLGILPHIAWHQSIVNKVLAGRVTGFDLILTAPDDRPEVGLSYYIPADRAERRTLTTMIDDAIERETEARGLPVGLFVPTLVVNVLDHDAQPPYLH